MDNLLDNTILDSCSQGHFSFESSYDHVSLKKRILGRLPKILIYSSFAVLAIIYACTVTASLPVLFIGGIVFASVFALRAIAESWRIFNKKSYEYDDYEENGGSRTHIERQRLLDIGSLIILGLALIALGISFVIAPSVLSVFMHLPVIFKIGSAILGMLFICKSASYFKSKAFQNLLGCVVKNLPDTFLYASGLALGIFSLIMTGGLAIVPILFTSIFACRTAASICHMFPNINLARNLARAFETSSLMIIGLGLLFAGILVAPAIATSLGISALFVKIATITIGSLFIFSGAAKMWVGKKLEDMNNWSWYPSVALESREFFDSEISGINIPVTENRNCIII